MTDFDSSRHYGPTPFEAWLALRDNRVAASRAAGRLHLDQIPLYVETVRGRRIRNVHDALEWGIAYTVANTGEVVVLWPDAHSQGKNSIGLQEIATANGTRLGLGSWLPPTDLADYVVETGPGDIIAALRETRAAPRRSRVLAEAAS